MIIVIVGKLHAGLTNTENCVKAGVAFIVLVASVMLFINERKKK